MKLHRFYTKEIDIIKDPKLVHQLLNVLRFKAGQEIILFNGDGYDYTVSLQNIVDGHLPRSKKIEIEIKNKIENKIKPKRKIILFQSLIKKDNFELVVEKVTEIGVSKIVPILSERSEKKGINIERINKITKEAAEQSGRNSLPVISPMVSFSEATENIVPNMMVFHLEGKAFHDYFSQIDKSGQKNIAIFIGPEGGWSGKEIESFRKKGIEIVTLGGTTLRAETAAISITSLLLL